MTRRLLAALAAVLVLAACGGGDGGGGISEGTAALWVTRDQGSEVVLTATVPAGLTVLQALDREAEIETSYGGRFVQAIDGVEGSLAGQQDWFYFVNGIEPDVGAAEVELHAGDVAWWDFRSWAEVMEAPVVVGAFPEPFLHGFDGKARPLEVTAPPQLAAEARALTALLRGRAADPSADPNAFVLEIADGVEGATLTATRGQANDSPVTFTLAGSPAAVRAAAQALARDPGIVRYRYTARFDEAGKVAG
jgi:hypothetical protein